MNALGPAIGALVVAAITPSPNNTLMMRSALQGGWIAASKTLFTILADSLVLFLLASLFLSVIRDQFPSIVIGGGVAGAFYLAWMGLDLGQRWSRADICLPEPCGASPH